MVQYRFVATPWGVRKDWVTPSGECIRSEYLPNSLATAPSFPDAANFWRLVAFWAIAFGLTQGIAIVLFIITTITN